MPETQEGGKKGAFPSVHQEDKLFMDVQNRGHLNTPDSVYINVV